jgi:hypothetical protein
MRDGSQLSVYIGVFYFVFRFPNEVSGVSYAKTADVQVTARFKLNHCDGEVINMCVPFIHPVYVLEHKLQQIFGAQTLS